MSKEKKVEPTQEEKQIMQINFYIIRRLWKYHNNRVNDLYKLLPLGKSSYTAIILKTYTSKCAHKELPSVTGLGADIFLGKKMIEIIGVTCDDWVEYTKQRYEVLDSAETITDIQKVRRSQFMSDFDIKITQEFNNITNYDVQSNLYRLNHFAKYQVKLSDNIEYVKMDKCMEFLNSIEVRDWKLFDLDILEEHEKILVRQLEVVSTIVKYKNLTK